MKLVMDKKYTLSWFILAVSFLGVGGAFALLVALSRTPFGYRFLPADFLFQGIVGHVILAIVFWLMSFTIVLWSAYFKGPEFKFSYIIAVVGALLVTVAVFTEGAKAVSNNYIPTIDDPIFFAGIGLFFVALSLNALCYLKDALRSYHCEDVARAVLAMSPPVALIMISALVVSVFTFAGAGLGVERGTIFFERLFWIPGHIEQVLNGILLITVWYALKKAMGFECAPFRFMKFFNLMLIISSVVLFVIPFVLDPLDKSAKGASEIVYAVGLGIPIFAHAINTMKGLKRKAVKDGCGVLYVALALSMFIYFFGIAIAYSGFGNDLRVPAHYHGAVTALTLAMMGLSHHYLKGVRLTGVVKRLADIQPAVYGVGMILVISGLMVSGIFGAPRKTYGVSFTNDPVVLTALTVMGIGTLLAVTGGVLFVFYSTFSLYKEARSNVRFR